MLIDDFFLLTGTYRFDASKLGQAHSWCQENTLRALKDPECLDVIVNNTFSMAWERKPYLRMAEDTKTRVCVIDLFDGGLSDGDLARRNIHGVPENVIRNMRQRWEHFNYLTR
jgi:hypothetical protein